MKDPRVALQVRHAVEQQTVRAVQAKTDGASVDDFDRFDGEAARTVVPVAAQPAGFGIENPIPGPFDLAGGQ